jgi:hypothetical protein
VVVTFVEGEVAKLAYQVDGAGGDDDAVGGCNGSGLRKGTSDVRRGVGRDIECMGGGEEVFQGGGAGVVDGGEDDVIVTALWGAGGGVEEGEENLGHLLEVFVAEAGEEEGAGLELGELGEGGPEGPGTGWIVSHVEEEAGTSFEGDEFEAAGPAGVTDSCFDVGIGNFVTYTVTCLV